MKLFICFLVSFFSMCTLSANESMQDNVYIKEMHIPILIERIDNELFEIRIDAKESKMLNELQLTFGGDVKLSEIEAVKLYYSGTEASTQKDKNTFAPVNYISSNKEECTFAANYSYSILKSEVKSPVRSVILKAEQKLYPGVNYFWISLQMNKKASVLSKISAEIGTVKVDGKDAPCSQINVKQEHYLGVGVRHAGDEGISAFRIPGLVTTNNGTLLGVYDIRHNNSKDLQEYIEIGVSRSTNGGQTWEKMRTAIALGECDGMPKSQNGVGDPAILVDRQTGTIWIVAAWTHGMGVGAAWWNSLQGMTQNQTAQLIMAKSDDDGKTWSAPINITEQVKDPSWYFLLQGPGRGISMEDGTLVFASQFIGSDRIPNSSIIYSKDHGKNWHMGSLARPNTTEAQVAEVTPGVLMLNMRDNRGGSRAVSTTDDLGKTWKEHVSSRTSLREPVCMASLISVKAKDNVLGKDILLFSNPDDTKARKNITIKSSLDGGVTWLSANQVLLDINDGWGYSCLTMIDKETVGILYESSVAHMTFQAIKLKDIISHK